eukprot:GILI01027551.1.p1 GENE.GILI01027551.1~~GILI01027551.1.p1  ORF type:complete len:259 (-),score=49.72 GILI01027551.1:221-997(-)
MVSFSLSLERREALGRLVDSESIRKELRQNKKVSLALIKRIRALNPSIVVHEALRGSTLDFDSNRTGEAPSSASTDDSTFEPAPFGDFPSIQAWREDVKRRQEEQEYQRLVSNVTIHRSDDGFTAQDRHMWRMSLSISAHFIISFVGGFFVGFYLGKFMGLHYTACLILGLLASIAILLVETLLFIIRSYKEDIMQADAEKLKKKKSRRVVAPSGLSEDGPDEDEEKEKSDSVLVSPEDPSKLPPHSEGKIVSHIHNQ